MDHGDMSKNQKLFYGSSYDRGLQYLLFIWSDVIEKYPEAELHTAYGWDMFDKVASHNPERRKWKQSMLALMDQKGMTDHGRLGKEELHKVRQQCGIWAYPTDFTEINCISALEAQKDGLVPVVCDFKSDFNGENHYTALSEVVKTGVIVKGDIRSEDVQKEYLTKLLELMGNEEEWKAQSTKAKKSMSSYSWDKIADTWTKTFLAPLMQPKVTIITPTIRKGFWNLMAHNIANQTYKNVEWIVVDDYPEDRRNIMARYCKDHGLKDWKYLRGGRTDKYYFGLSSANNIGLKNAEGELLVFLQDFVLMSLYGIEALVDIYRHNPDALIAPTDTYYYPKVEPKTNTEDWFSGELDVIGEFHWKSVRNKGLGMRDSTNPGDFEMNFGAIPKAIADSLGGWWEFFNDGLGFDNTEIAYRALKSGYRILVDDSNKAVCIDHWKALKDKPEEAGEKREHRLNDPRYIWMAKMIDEGKLQLKRNPKIDGFRLSYDMPEKLTKDEASDWIRKNGLKIANKWGDAI